MADFFFFTDIDLITASDVSTNGQLDTDSFGYSNSAGGQDNFLVSSVFKSNDLFKNPKAYAVTKGNLAAIIHSNDLHVTLVLKPSIQLSKLKNVNIPKIKYFVYHGVLANSIFNSTRTEINTTPNQIGLRDYLLTNYKPFVSSAVPPPADCVKAINTNGYNTLIKKSFETKITESTYPELEEGTNLGEFDPNGFSFEIILDDMGYDNLDLQSLGNNLDPIRHYISAPSLPASPSTQDYFNNINSKEEILHYFDPCTFYGNLISKYKSFVAKISAPGTLPINNENDYYNNILLKFYNQSTCIIDIRNEYNNSFNYYKYSLDDYFSAYNDNIFIKTESTGGTNNILQSYYTNGWPLLFIRNDSVTNNFGTLDGNKTILSFEFDKGNNNSPLVYVSQGYLSNGNAGGNFKYNKAEGKKRFVGLENSTLNPTMFGTLKLEIPNQIKTGSPNVVKIVPSYIRLKYLRGLNTSIISDYDGAANPQSAIPSPDEVQFLDFLFETTKMDFDTPYTAGHPRVKIYEEERYLNLLQPHNSGTEFIANIGIAEDDANITLFAYSFAKRSKRSRRISRAMSLISKDNSNYSDFIYELDSNYRFNKIRTNQLYFVTPTTNEIDVISIKDNKLVKLLRRFVDPSSSEMVAIIIKKSNYTSLQTLINSLPTNAIGKQLVITNRNDRNANLKDDTDEAASVTGYTPEHEDNIKYFKSELAVNYFNPTTLTRTVAPASIMIYAAVDDDNKSTIQNFYKDKDASFNNPLPKDYSCALIDFNKNRPSNTITMEHGFRTELNTKLAELYKIEDSEILSGDEQLTHNLQKYSTKILGQLYRDDLRFFIYELYNTAFSLNSLLEPTGIINYPSFLMYKYVASRFIKLDTTPFVLNLAHLSKSGTGSVTVFKPQGFSNDDTNAGNINFITTDPVNQNSAIKLPEIFEQSFLLDFSVMLAMYKASRDLEFIHSYLVGDFKPKLIKLSDGGVRYEEDKNKSFSGLIKGLNDSHFDEKGDFAEKYFNPTLQVLVNNYPFYANLIQLLNKYNLKAPDKNTKKFHDKEKFKDYVKIFNPHYLFQDEIKAKNNKGIISYIQSSYKAINNDAEMDRLKIFQLLNELNDLKSDYIKSLASCISNKLGGSLDCVNLEIVGLIKGGGTSLLPGGALKGCFFVNPYLKINSSKLVSIYINHGDTDLINFTLNLYPNIGKNNYFHWMILGLDDDSYHNGTPYYPIPAPGVTIPPEQKRSTSSRHKLTALKTERLQPDDDNKLSLYVYPNGIQNNGAPKSWGISKELPKEWESSPSNEILGIYNDHSKEIILSDEVRGLNIASEMLVDESKGGFENNCVIFTTYCYKGQNPYYVFAAQDLFNDDRFLITQSKKDKLFSAANDTFLPFIIERLKDIDVNIAVNMLGGHIGKMIIPEAFSDQNQYSLGNFVIFNSQIYKANSNIAAGAFNASQWSLFNYNSANSYLAGDYVRYTNGTDAPEIYRAPLNISTGAAAPGANGSDWERICTIWQPNTVNRRNDFFLKEDNGSYTMYKCLNTNKDKEFNRNKYILVSAVDTDANYLYTGNDYTSVLPEVKDNPTSPSINNLAFARKFSQVRYSYASIEYELSSNTVTFNVKSFASPLRSRLDINLQSGKKPTIDPFTIYGQVLTNAPGDISLIGAMQTGGSLGNNVIPSYNQLLTSLRCWGFLQALMEQIQNYGDVMSDNTTDTTLANKIADILANTAKVRTTSAGSHMVQDTFIFKTNFDSISLNETP